MFALKPVTKRTALLPWTEAPFGWLREEFEPLFNRFFTNWPVVELPEWRYPVTMEEREKEFVFRTELPGFEATEVKVELTPERLTVEAEHKAPAAEPTKNEGEKPVEKAERAYAHVKRVMTVPPEVELEKAEAIYRNGVLEVHLPRKPEAVGRRIEVKT